MKERSIRDIRAFSRFYTDLIGLLDQHLLHSAYSLAEARIIYEIWQSKGITASHIMANMQIDKSYLSRLLQKLEKEKIITKERSTADARVTELSLTPKGQKTFEQLNKASDDQVAALLTPLTDEQSEQLSAHMKAIMLLLKK